MGMRGEGEIGQHTEQGEQDGVDGLDEEHPRHPGHVVDHPAALQQDVGQDGEIGVQQHHLGRLPGGLTAVGHGDGAVGLPHGQDVVHSVPGHGYPVALVLKGLDQLALLLRGDPAEHGVLLGGPEQLILGVHLAHVHPGGVLQSGLGRHGGRRRWVVAGDDLDADPLPPEVVQGVGGPGADGVGEDQGGQGRHFRERAIRIDGKRGGSNHQHPFAPPDLRAQLLREARAGHAVGRAHHQSAQLREGHSAPLPLGGEGNFSGGRLGNVPVGKAGPHGLEGGVVVVDVGQERPHPIRQGNGQVLCQLLHPLHPHVSLGEGAGLVLSLIHI